MVVLVTKTKDNQDFTLIKRLLKEWFNYPNNKPLPAEVIDSIIKLKEDNDYCYQAILDELRTNKDEIIELYNQYDDIIKALDTGLDIIKQTVGATDKAIKDELSKRKYSRPSSVDQIELDELYQYVKKLLGYGDNIALPTSMVLKLKGLRNGKYIANNKTANTCEYSYKTVLNTFKACSMEIKRALLGKKFTDENHKFNYILVIVRGKLHEIAAREQRIVKANEKAETMTVATPVNDDNYVRKAKPLSDKQAKRLEHLW